MEITSVEKNRKNKDRFSVYIDDSYAFSISEDDYISLGLYEKKEITAEEIEYIRNTINFRAAKNDGIRYLALKLRTAGEVSAKLSSLGYDYATVEKAIDEISALGYINNKLYVQKYVFDRSKLKPISKRLIRLELLAKGITAEDIDEVLDSWDVDESVVAEGLVKKKFGKYDMKDDKTLRKIYMFLRHRGFSGELVDEIIGKIRCSGTL
jgi:regulatory protein